MDGTLVALDVKFYFGVCDAAMITRRFNATTLINDQVKMPRFCQHPDGCKKQPVFGHPGGKALFCVAHKHDRMEDVKNKHCQHPDGCKKIPIFGHPGGETLFCATHKHDGMEGIRNKRCRHLDGCKKRPTFGRPGDEAIFCVEHKQDGMEDVRSRRCRHPEGCKKRPTFGHPGGDAMFCKTHMQCGMLDVTNPMCPGATCQKGPDGMCPLMKRGNPKYENYCVECFCREFPADPRTATARKHSKELVVRDFLFATFPGLDLVHDLPLWTGGCDCTHRRRVDFRCMVAGVMLAIEVDEHQHKDRDAYDEEIRYDDLCMIHTGPWVFIRYNPDMYKDAHGNRKNPHVDTRLATLKSVINEWVSALRAGVVDFEGDLVKIVRLFCDEKGGLSPAL